jgi:hypothetical protein
MLKLNILNIFFLVWWWPTCHFTIGSQWDVCCGVHGKVVLWPGVKILTIIVITTEMMIFRRNLLSHLLAERVLVAENHVNLKL